MPLDLQGAACFHRSSWLHEIPLLNRDMIKMQAEHFANAYAAILDKLTADSDSSPVEVDCVLLCRLRWVTLAITALSMLDFANTGL